MPCSRGMKVTFNSEMLAAKLRAAFAAAFMSGRYTNVFLESVSVSFATGFCSNRMVMVNGCCTTTVSGTTSGFSGAKDTDDEKGIAWPE